MLVKVSINPSNNNKYIYKLFQIKLAQYTTVLATLNLSLSEIIEGYNCFWWPSIKFMALTLTLNPKDNILQKFHRTILLRIKINYNIPQALISIPFYMGSFQMKSLEMEQTIESINTFITNFKLNLLTKDLLVQLLEYM